MHFFSREFSTWNSVASVNSEWLFSFSHFTFQTPTFYSLVLFFLSSIHYLLVFITFALTLWINLYFLNTSLSTKCVVEWLALFECWESISFFTNSIMRSQTLALHQHILTTRVIYTTFIVCSFLINNSIHFPWSRINIDKMLHCSLIRRAGLSKL